MKPKLWGDRPVPNFGGSVATEDPIEDPIEDPVEDPTAPPAEDSIRNIPHGVDFDELESQLRRTASRDGGATEEQKARARQGIADIESGKVPDWLAKSFGDNKTIPGRALNQAKDLGMGLLDMFGTVGSFVAAPIFTEAEQNRSSWTGDVRPEQKLRHDGSVIESDFWGFDAVSRTHVPRWLPGADWLASIGVGDKSLMPKEVAAGFLGGHDNKFPESIPLIGGKNAPDWDTLAGAFAVGLVDPRYGLGLPGVRALKTADEAIPPAGGAARVMNDTGTIHTSRQSKEVNQAIVAENFRNYSPEIQGATKDAYAGVMKALDEGNVQRAVRVARKGDGGFNADHLRMLGLQTNLAMWGKQVKGTEGFVAFVGRWGTGQRTSKAQRGALKAAADDGRFVGKLNYRSGRAAERLGRMAEGVSVKAVRHHITGMVDNADELAGPTPLGLFTVAEVSRKAGRVANQLQSEAGDVTRIHLEGTTLALKAEPGNITEIDEALYTMLASNEMKGGVQPKSDARSVMPVLNKLSEYADLHDYRVADLTKTNMQLFYNDDTIPVAIRMAAPPVIHGLLRMDKTSIAQLKMPDGFLSQKVSDLAGYDGVVSRGAGTVRQHFNNLAIVEVADSAVVTHTIQLENSLFQATQHPNAVVVGLGAEPGDWLAQNVVNASNTTVEQAADVANQIVEMVKNAKTSQGFAMPTPFLQQLARASNMDRLKARDLEGLVLGITRTGEVLQNHKEGLKLFLKGLIHDVSEKSGKGYKYARRQYGDDAVDAAHALVLRDKRTVANEVEKIIKNGWYHPEMGKVGRNGEPFAMFSGYDRAVISVVRDKYPAMIDAQLAELDEMLEMIGGLARTFARYDEILPADQALLSKSIEAWSTHHTITVRLFGGDAVDALNGAGSTGQLIPMTQAQAAVAADRAMDLRIATGDPHLRDRFGERSLTSSASETYRRLPASMQATFDFNAPGVVEDHWVGAMKETSILLNAFQRAQIGHRELQAALDFLGKTNRVVKGEIASTPDFMLTNFGGGVIENFYRGGVRMHGPGGYQDFFSVEPIIRRALRDELDNGLTPRTSRIWGEVARRKAPHVKADDLENAQVVAYSDAMTSSAATGDPIDFVYEVDRAVIGSGRAATAVKRYVGVTDRFGARVEQALQPLQRRILTGNLNPLKPAGVGIGNRARYSAKSKDGISSSLRETTEGNLRGAMIWSALKKDGYGPHAAMERVASVHIDYWDITNNGKIIDTLMPFYLFRSRMVSASLRMAMSTPGMVEQFRVINEDSSRRDPFFNPGEKFEFVAGTAGAFQVSVTVDDPRLTGLEFPRAVADTLSGATPGGLSEFARVQILDQLAPLPAVIIDGVQNVRHGWGRADTDYLDDASPVEYSPGFTSYLAEAAMWSDDKISILTNALSIGDMNLLVGALELTGHARLVNGQLYVTDTAEAALREDLPRIAQIEAGLRMFVGSKWDPNGKLTEAEHDQKIQRQAYNAWARLSGGPLKFIDSTHQQVIVDARSEEVRRLNAINMGSYKTSTDEALRSPESQENIAREVIERLKGSVS